MARACGGGVCAAVGCGAWRGVWRGACGDGEKFEGVGMTAQKVSLAVLDALRVTALRK